MVARDQAELAKLEAFLAEKEMSDLTSTPAVENAAATTFMHATGGICFSDPPVVPKMQLKPAVHESNMPKPVKGDCQKESKSQPLTFVSSINTPSTVTPSVSGSTVNESLAAIMSSMERINASHDLPHVRVQIRSTIPFLLPEVRTTG